jgi:hypothetical protein
MNIGEEVDIITTVKLTEKELFMLDGNCSQKVQDMINKIKMTYDILSNNLGLAKMEAYFIAKIIEEAKINGILTYQEISIRTCQLCDKEEKYHKYPRYSRYHNKGENNYDKPILYFGVELAVRTVIIQHVPTLGCCLDCYKIIKEALIYELETRKIRAEIHESIIGHKPIYKKYRNIKCKKCDWIGHEGKRREYYKCPKCGERSFAFLDGFVIERIK